MLEDKEAVQKQIAELDKNFPPAKWDSVEGFHTNFMVTINSDKTQDVNGSRGITLKLFVNTETKEIKYFYYDKFIKSFTIRLKR